MPKTTSKQMMKSFFDYVKNSPTAAHNVAESEKRLKAAGFKRLDEGKSWKVQSGTKGYVIRGSSSLVAFRVGNRPVEETGFRALGSHTDSPSLRLRPNPCYESDGFLMLGVEVYGGALLGTWTDRDLSLAGRLIVDKKGKPEVVLVDIKRPVCRVPQLAIHLNREVNDKGLKLNKQKHMPPILGLTDKKLDSSCLLPLLAECAGVDEDAILDFTLDCYDTQPPAIGGMNEEFYFSPHIDNQAGCFSALEALIQAKKCDATAVVALFDNEEIGSNSYVGAASTLFDVVFERLCMGGKNPREKLLRATAKSILVSSDGAHALHPNYSDMHDKHHHPMLNGGPVIKVHAAQKYATTVETKAYFMDCCRRANIPWQVYSHRADLASGSTIGPISCTRLGIPTVDVGVPMLSMHSIREMGGVEDIHLMTQALVEHFVGR